MGYGLLSVLLFWVLLGGILGALVAPRQGWTAGNGALIGGIFGLFGVLFLLVKAAPRPSAEMDRIADELESYQAAQEGRETPVAASAYIPCPECGNPVPAKARRCPKCQTELTTCDECGGVIPVDEMTCRYCGTEYIDDAEEGP